MEIPKETAKRLVDKFTEINGNGFFAKDCALIVVKEILLEIMPKGARNGSQRCRELHWHEVETEIKKLA